MICEMFLAAFNRPPSETMFAPSIFFSTISGDKALEPASRNVSVIQTNFAPGPVNFYDVGNNIRLLRISREILQAGLEAGRICRYLFVAGSFLATCGSKIF